LARGYLPKLTIAILLVGVALIVVTAQPGQVSASYHHHYYSGWYSYPYYNNCNYWGYGNYTNNWGYGYPYYYNNCYYSSYYYPYYGYGYYGYPYYGSYYSNYYAPTSYTLTVATNPSNLGTTTGGGSYTSGTSASFSVSQNTVQVSPTTRYVFSHWSGDYSGVGTSGSVTMNGAMTVTAVYQEQYLLTANAQPQNAPVPQGGGWFNAGDTATIQNGGQTIGGDGGSRLNFQGWQVDGQPSQSSPTLVVTMNAPHTVTALYNQQYYLNVQSDQGSAYGSGWYDAGSTAQVYASTPTSTSYGVNMVFNGWQGDLQSSSQNATVAVDKPMNVIATWRSDPTVLYLTVAGVIIAALLVVGGLIIAFARGRGTQAPPPQAVQTTTPTPPPSTQTTTPASTHTSNHHRTEHHRRKTETVEKTDETQPQPSNTTDNVA